MIEYGKKEKGMRGKLKEWKMNLKKKKGCKTKRIIEIIKNRESEKLIRRRMMTQKQRKKFKRGQEEEIEQKRIKKLIGSNQLKAVKKNNSLRKTGYNG